MVTTIASNPLPLPLLHTKKHRPTPALRSYCEAVNEAVQAVLSDAKAALGAR
jgi:hypothetical protein